MFLGRRKIWFEALDYLVCVLVMGLVFGMLLFLWSNRYLTPRPDRPFSGVVADKWVSISETEQGSYMFPRVLVKTDDGELRRVEVDTDTYNRLQLSMRVEHDAHGTRLESSDH